MARVSIDETLCTGCGLCESGCPEVFKLEDDGLAHVIADSCSDHDLNDLAQQCPVEAIKVE